MDLLLITADGLQKRPVEELDGLLGQPDVLLWLDIPLCDRGSAAVLSKTFGFHDLAVRDCLERNPHREAPRVRRSRLHGPARPADRHPRACPLRRTRPVHGTELPGHRARATEPGSRSPCRVHRHRPGAAAGHADPEPFLEELFKTWYELLAIRTIGVHSAAVYDRLAKLVRSLPEAEKPLVADISERFEQVVSMADGQREFLHGVIEFFQTRTSTHTTIAAESLNATSVQQNDDMRKITAWVAIVAVPTAVTGFFGQNVPYPGFGQESGFLASLAIMIIIAAALYVIFKRKDWL